jgi:hypothetical protein
MWVRVNGGSWNTKSVTITSSDFNRGNAVGSPLSSGGGYEFGPNGNYGYQQNHPDNLGNPAYQLDNQDGSTLASLTAFWAAAGLNTNNAYVFNATFASATIPGYNVSIRNSTQSYGTGYVDGYYFKQATTGGTGTGLTVSYNQGGGNVYEMYIDNPGSGYTSGDVITLLGTSLTPTTFTIDVTAAGTTTSPYTCLIRASWYNNALNMIVIDQSDTSWQGGGGGYIGTSLVGKFMLPVTLTPYTPTTQLGNYNDWC